jgi:protein phosphatase
MRIELPELCVTLMAGPSGAGKSTFTAKHFRRTEILSSDTFRGLVSDDESDQSVTQDAFEALYYIAAKRLRNRKLTVIDATNVRPEDRKGFVELAARFHCPPVAIVLDMPEGLCQNRNATRPGRDVGPHVVQTQLASLRLSLDGLKREGFQQVYILSTPAEVDAVEIVRIPAESI